MGQAKFRVTLYDYNASTRGPNTIKAIFDDAKFIGVSDYANDGGDFFMTIPWNHTYASEIKPWERHYRVSRIADGVESTIGRGVINDFDATESEIVVYGQDYLSLLATTISGSNTSYTSQTVGAIITDQLSSARAEANSWVNFISIGSIDATTTTIPLALTSYQERLEFLRDIIRIHVADTSVRSQLYVTRDPPYQFVFNQNRGSDCNLLRLGWGRQINRFSYQPGYADLRTRIAAIGQKREGASLLFSQQTYASESTYGWIASGRVFIDIVNQSALDRKTKAEARRASQLGAPLFVLSSTTYGTDNLAPWSGYELCDSVPVYLQRGDLINITGSLFTIWGQEWTGYEDGHEDLFLHLEPKLT